MELEEMDNLLERHRLPKLTQDNLNRSKTSENWISNQKLPTKKNPGSDSFNGEFYKAFKKLKPIPHKHFQKTEEGRILHNLFYEVVLLWPHNQTNTSKENYRRVFLSNIDTKASGKYKQPRSNPAIYEKCIYHDKMRVISGA